MATLVAQFVEACNAHDPDRLVELCAPTYEGLDVGQAEPVRGAEGMRQSLSRYLRAFPDLEITPLEVVVQGNRVVLSWTGRGTHRGRLFNIPPTERQVAVRGISLLTVEDHKVCRALHVWDVAALLRDLGLLPDL